MKPGDLVTANDTFDLRNDGEDEAFGATVNTGDVFLVLQIAKRKDGRLYDVLISGAAGIGWAIPSLLDPL